MQPAGSAYAGQAETVVDSQGTSTIGLNTSGETISSSARLVSSSSSLLQIKHQNLIT